MTSPLEFLRVLPGRRLSRHVLLPLPLQPVDDVVTRIHEAFDAVREAGLGASVESCTRRPHALVPARWRNFL